MKKRLAGAGLALALISTAPVPEGAEAAARKGAEQCFFARNMTSFAPVGRERLNIRVGVNDYYQIDLLGTCQDLDWTQRIGLQSRGSDWICSGLDVTLIVPSSTLGPQRCNATSIRKLTPDEVKALPRKEKP
jgi:hypothetical protein